MAHNPTQHHHQKDATTNRHHEMTPDQLWHWVWFHASHRESGRTPAYRKAPPMPQTEQPHVSCLGASHVWWIVAGRPIAPTHELAPSMAPKDKTTRKKENARKQIKKKRTSKQKQIPKRPEGQPNPTKMSRPPTSHGPKVGHGYLRIVPLPPCHIGSHVAGGPT